MERKELPSSYAHPNADRADYRHNTNITNGSLYARSREKYEIISNGRVNSVEEVVQKQKNMLIRQDMTAHGLYG